MPLVNPTFISRLALTALTALAFSGTTVNAAAKPLSPAQVKTFRSWIVTIVEDQMSRGPNPRWTQQDCAGLVRFAVNESLNVHDARWRKANGFLGRPLPAEIEISKAERENLKMWRSSETEKSQFVRALPLIQGNAEFIGKTLERIEPGDLLFFDQDDEQHLMVWTGRRVVYHNGHHQTAQEKKSGKDRIKDNGLRAVTFNELMTFKDSRWQPKTENPNFIGFYRLSFLSPSIGQQL